MIELKWRIHIAGNNTPHILRTLKAGNVKVRVWGGTFSADNTSEDLFTKEAYSDDILWSKVKMYMLLEPEESAWDAYPTNPKNRFAKKKA